MILPATTVEQMKVTSKRESGNQQSDKVCDVFSADEFSHKSYQVMESHCTDDETNLIQWRMQQNNLFQPEKT